MDQQDRRVNPAMPETSEDACGRGETGAGREDIVEHQDPSVRIESTATRDHAVEPPTRGRDHPMPDETSLGTAESNLRRPPSACKPGTDHPADTRRDLDRKEARVIDAAMQAPE